MSTRRIVSYLSLAFVAVLVIGIPIRSQFVETQLANSDLIVGRNGPPQGTPGWEYSNLIMGENPGKPAFFRDIFKTGRRKEPGLRFSASALLPTPRCGPRRM